MRVRLEMVTGGEFLDWSIPPARLLGRSRRLEREQTHKPVSIKRQDVSITV